MAQLSAIRDALKATVATAVPSLRIYDTVPEVANLPALVIEPVTADYTFSMSLDACWYFDLIVMVPRVDSVRSQDQLDTYVAAYGSNSIRKAVWDADSLGLSDTTATVTGMRGYGGSHDSNGLKHIGAILRVSVHTGTA